MKTLNVTFEDEEYNQLAKVKNGKNLSWHDFILTLLEKQIKNGTGDNNEKKHIHT